MSICIMTTEVETQTDEHATTTSFKGSDSTSSSPSTGTAAAPVVQEKQEADPLEGVARLLRVLHCYRGR